MLELAVLGPLSAARDGAAVPLGGARQREVLGVLLAAHGDAVTAARVVQDAWCDAPGAGSRATLAAYVSRLRRLLPEVDLGGSSGGTYCLVVPAETRDDVLAARLLNAAREASAGGQPEDARAAAERGLALYRGQPYAGLTSPAVLRERLRLEELHDLLVEQLAQARLALGHPEQALVDLEPLAGTDPPRSETCRLRALCLAATGQQPQALAVLRTALHSAPPEARPALVELEQELLARPVPAAPAPAAAPLPLSSFVGRGADLVALSEAMRTSRLVTVVGSGGAGKTRLALELLRGLPRDDVAWVPLAALHDGALVATAVEQAVSVPLGVRRRSPPELVVVDNAEHLREEVARCVRRLLQQHPEMRVLVTTREPLGVAGERLLELGPLPVDGAAVQLFLDRARQVAPGWDCSEEELAAVRRICAGLDGLPLALELAAAQCQALPPGAIADGLSDRFALLVATSDRQVQHHRTLDAAIAWSYDRLTPCQQQTFRALAVFAGPFDLDAARALLGREAASAVADLAERSLVTVNRSTKPRQYALLDSLRAFAATRTSAAERDDLEERHAAWAAGLAETAAQELLTGEAAQWLRRLESTLPDLHAAVHRDIAHGRGERAVTTAGRLSWFFYRRRRPVEGSDLLSAAVDAAPPGPSRDRARNGLTHLLALQGQLEAAVAHACAVVREAQDEAVEVSAQSALGWMLAMTGDLTSGRKHAELGLARAAAMDDALVKADATLAAAHVTYLAGDLQRTALLVDEAGAHARRAGYSWAWTQASWLLAKTSLRSGQTVRASTEAAALVRTACVAENAVLVLSGILLLAVAAARLDRLEDAAGLLGAVTARAQDQLHEVDLLDGPAYAAEVRSKVDAARLHDALRTGAEWDEETTVAKALKLASGLSKGLMTA